MQRVLLYCHNVEGLGHIAMSVRIAEALNDRGGAHVTIVTGCRFLEQFRRRVAHRSFVDFHPLPWLAPSFDGSLLGEDGRAKREVLAERERMICSFAREWQPDVFVADHNPAGLYGELWPTLETARRERWRTKFVWGARDIWDSPELPERLKRMIRKVRLQECLEHYDGVMAYSDAGWIDTLGIYERGKVRLPRLREAVGFVTPPVAAPEETTDRAKPRLVLAMGGGASGERLTEIVWTDVKDLVRSGRLDMRIAMGPRAEPPAIDWAAEGVEIVTDMPVEAVIRDADVTVSTAGYGTAYTVIQGVFRNVMVPFPASGQEQLFRATKLATLPGIAAVAALQQTAAGRVRRRLDELLSAEPRRSLPFSVDGAATAAAFVENAALETPR